MIDVVLDNFINEKKLEAFEWGKLDCVLFACDWCERVSGINPAQGSYGAYDNEEDAYKHLESEYGGIEAGFDKYFGQISPAFRQKGDDVLCKMDDYEFAGVCGARGFIFFKTENKGIRAIRNPDIISAWRIE